MYLYELHNKDKVNCPECKHSNCFSLYINTSTNQLLDAKYGRCDRENNCGYHCKPENNRRTDANILIPEVQESILDFEEFPDIYMAHFKKEYKVNNLMRGLIPIFGKERVLETYNKYKLANWVDGAMIFTYYTFALHTGKIIWYDDSLHRIKEGRKGKIMWLHNASYKSDDGYDYSLNEEKRITIPLFGAHLLWKDDSSDRFNKYVCLVESEKSAIIMSMVFPQYKWLATGGLLNLNKNKFGFFQNRRVLVFPDLGVYKRENISVKDFWRNKMNEVCTMVSITYAIVNFVPANMYTEQLARWTEQGKDVVDFLFEYPDDWMQGVAPSYIEFLNSVIEDAKRKC